MELIFQKSIKNRRGSSLPDFDIPEEISISSNIMRTEKAKLPEVSELEVIRHFKALAKKNIGVDTCFYPLGSCTMKYNPKFHEKIASLPGFANLHPLLPQLCNGGALTQGALTVIYELENILSELLGFESFTMQPMAGAHGELTGAMLMAAYHKYNGDTKRNTILIPDSAHGTNPSSAAIAGFDTKTIPTDSNGNVDLDILKDILDETVAGIMITSPSTLGLYDENINEVCKLIHDFGGLVYGDGANLNAIIGKVKPGEAGFDLMHINLHKTFATPHGGGGPGAGPVGVSKKLVPFLPTSRIKKRSDGTYSLEYTFEHTIGYIAPFYGNFGIILRAYAYVLTLGKKGFLRVSENALINANYIRTRLSEYYSQKFDRECMHECVFSASKQEPYGVHAIDIAKALIDRGFHPPTIYFPQIVHEAIMIEPTETESKQTIDKFIDAMIEIANFAKNAPEQITNTPRTTLISRLDETLAARKPIIADLDS